MAVMLNGAGEKHARSLIEAGQVDKESAWSFSAEDGDKLLGADGKNWPGYGTWFLGVDAEANNETKEHYKYPVGKDGKVYRGALIAIRQRAGQQDAAGVFDAAGKLIDAIDGGKSSALTVTRGTIAFPVEFKATASGEGVFTGLGSVYGNMDDNDDIIMPGCFTDSLKEYQASGRMPALLWQHDQRQPIGVYNSISEDKNGLRVEGKLALKTQKGAECYELMSMGALTGLSVGFITQDADYDMKTGVRSLKKAELIEISPVTFPANDGARVASVKSVDIITDFKSACAFLRNAGGFSRSEATAIVARLKNLTLRNAVEDEEALAELKSKDEMTAIAAALVRRQQVLRA